MRKKYLCIGEVLPNGDIVPASKLPELYGVSPGECVLFSTDYLSEFRTADLSNLIILTVRRDGNYVLPSEEEIT